MATADSTPRDSSADLLPELVLQPVHGWPTLNFAELWHHRELLFFLTWRDVKIRYKQTVLGVLWAILQPVLMMIVFTVVFGRMAKVPTDGIPYPIFVYTGLLPWTFFSRAITAASESVVRSERLVTKVYFPRLAIPIASIGAALVDLTIEFVVLFALMVYYGISPTWSFLLVIPLCLLTTCAALGFGTLLAALNVAYRDVRYVVPYFIQIWLFATPAVYMATTDRDRGESAAGIAIVRADDPNAQTQGDEANVPPSWSKRVLASTQRLLELNPLNGLIASFRAVVLNQPLSGRDVSYATACILFSLAVGVFCFRRLESSFADVV